jgi:hypothetical protein
MEENKQLTWKEFETKYKPIPNHITKDTDHPMFETYGEEWDFIKEQDPHKVWTWVQGDMSDLIVAGIGFVNRLGYYVCEEPWTDEWEHVLLSVEVECKCYSEDEDVVEKRDGEYGDPACEECEGYGYRTEYVD